MEAQSLACAGTTHAQVTLGCPYQICLCGPGQCYLAAEAAMVSYEHLMSFHRGSHKTDRQSHMVKDEGPGRNWH